MSLKGSELSVRAGGKPILRRASLEVRPGELVAIVGPNGAGKSTLLKALAGENSNLLGSVVLNGRALKHWRAEEIALQRAVLPQSPGLAFPFRVWDVVELGRYPLRGLASGDEHHAAITGAMDAADVTRFAERDCRTLSGGELHRVHFARTLAQIWAPLPDGRARFLLLDEPTAALDLSHQHAILARARGVASDGAGVLVVLHDLNLAAAFADRVVVMDKGGIVDAGTPGETLTTALIQSVWGVETEIVRDPATGRPRIYVRPQGIAKLRTIGEARAFAAE
ncbi:MAG: heme ABC transporter ATP-binding protein [Alphaproteobacteria bacterium]|nr:heme ABC transporter ATP-binding protein [Alphaproteobacteria bacterium]